ncbi:MAG: cache domain-containing protein [Ideonella sp.]|nr:MAG: HAMP domain-containing protein [Burkholderiaceae bacterium]MBE7426591.1 cache domain-containing protein [Ideonella sp.]
MAVSFGALSIRHKLLALGLLPLLLALPALAVILIVWGDSALDALLITKVRSDLAVAHGYFDRVQAEVGASTLAVAQSAGLVDAVQRDDAAALARLMTLAKEHHALEFLELLPASALAAHASEHGAGEGLAQVALLENAQFERIAPSLMGRVTVPLLPTRNAAPSERAVEDRALVMVAQAPVRALDGRVIGLLRGGVLLNRNLAFIDHINEIVYPRGALPFGSEGTATLLLEDVRISTNVRLFGTGSQRAIGTRASQAVRDAVLGRGDTWLDRAFVVDDWYVSAYEPLTSAAGRRIGMLYVGFLERPFQQVKLGVLLGTGAVMLVLMALAMMLALAWARRIFTPLERMTQTMHAVEAGDFSARTGVGGGDELGRLASHLDRLLDAIDGSTQALRRSHDDLDRKVVERTRELQSAQAQLIKSEKLAAIGQLTAGIAHEINNPIAVIQGNLDLMRETLGRKARPVQTELRLIDEQVERMRLIVTRLLQYARPGEYAGYVETVDTAQAIADSLVLVQHLLAHARVEVVRDLNATRPALINRQELQQVLINGLINAIQAMPEGGTLALSSRDHGDAQIEIGIADTGPGFGADAESECFRPFMTTKKEGTGLGLWISRGLVERYGGELRATNRTDGAGGALLTLVLPAETQASGPPSAA